jgi:hypothetical protein
VNPAVLFSGACDRRLKATLSEKKVNSMGKFAKKKETAFIKNIKFYAHEGKWGIDVGDVNTAKDVKYFAEGEFLPDFKNAQLGWFTFCDKDPPPGMPYWRSHGVTDVTGDTGPKPKKRDWPKEWGLLPNGDWQEMIRMHVGIVPEEFRGVRMIHSSAKVL